METDDWAPSDWERAVGNVRAGFTPILEAAELVRRQRQRERRLRRHLSHRHAQAVTPEQAAAFRIVDTQFGGSLYALAESLRGGHATA